MHSPMEGHDKTGAGKPASLGDIMVHEIPMKARKGPSHTTQLRPSSQLLEWWAASNDVLSNDVLSNDVLSNDVLSSRIEELLQTLDLDAVVTFNVILACILENEEGRTTWSLDDIIKMIGRDGDARKSGEARQEWRRKIWEWLLMFESMIIDGNERDGYWKEPAPAGKEACRCP